MRRLEMKNRNVGRGFTLMEMLLVVVIIAILAAVVAPMVLGRSDEAKISAAKANIDAVKLGMNQFYVHNGRFPTEQEGIAALVDNPGTAKQWQGPYIEKVPTDPWGNVLHYRVTEVKSKVGFDVFSMGPDGQENTPDDIGNW